jgi:hypothetical protein
MTVFFVEQSVSSILVLKYFRFSIVVFFVECFKYFLSEWFSTLEAWLAIEDIACFLGIHLYLTPMGQAREFIEMCGI